MTCQPDGSEQDSPGVEIQAPEVALPSAEILGPSPSACLLQQKQPKRKTKIISAPFVTQFSADIR